MNPRPRTLVIINHAAARARRAWAEVESRLTAHGVSFDAHETRHAGDATHATRAALRAGYQLIAVVGGDGTLSETAAGFFEFDNQPTTNDERKGNTAGGLPLSVNRDAALAILPAGTGDDFARGLAGRRAAIEHWLERFIRFYERADQSATRDVDVIHGKTSSSAGATNDFICLNVATLGLGAEVAGRVAAQGALVRRLPGEARFTLAACGALLAWRERRVRVHVDDELALECRSNLLALANGIYAGGGMMFAPQAVVDDGQLDLLLACDISRVTILRELPRIRRGAHLSNPHVRMLRCQHVSVETIDDDAPLPIEADGNVRGHTPAEFQIMPGAIRIVSPQRHRDTEQEQ